MSRKLFIPREIGAGRFVQHPYSDTFARSNTQKIEFLKFDLAILIFDLGAYEQETAGTASLPGK
jgi:hypothetical protein